MEIFKDTEEYKKWVDSQDWYQSIELKNGYKTPGKFPTYQRKAMFDQFDFTGKTVLDIGCNSGQYSIFAKERGAESVLGIDVLKKRVDQARTIALNEGNDINFEHRGIFELNTDKEKYDVVLCIAVLTEIADLFGAIEKIKSVTGDYALIELDIARPLLYLSRTKRWLLGTEGISRQKSLTEVRHSRTGGWVLSPTLAVLKKAFGDEFTVIEVPGGIRYDMIKVTRNKSDT
jgi:SAM-dependent methyltransferase